MALPTYIHSSSRGLVPRELYAAQGLGTARALNGAHPTHCGHLLCLGAVLIMSSWTCWAILTATVGHATIDIGGSLGSIAARSFLGVPTDLEVRME